MSDIDLTMAADENSFARTCSGAFEGARSRTTS
jgi:hypothetical protein